jgi:hypothetical protein
VKNWAAVHLSGCSSPFCHTFPDRLYPRSGLILITGGADYSRLKHQLGGELQPAEANR